MLKITENLCPADKFWLKATYPMQPIGVCIHNTANSATAMGEINYMLGNDQWTSFHYCVDENEAVHAIPLDRNSWHASDGDGGVGNRYYISIEIARSYVINGNEAVGEEIWRRDYKALFEKAQENAAELTAIILHNFGWGKDLSRIKRHADFTNKYCPHRTMSEYGWDYFLNLVEAKYTELYEEAPMTAAEKKEFEALVEKVSKLEAKVKTHNDQIGIKWKYVDKNLPEWVAPTVKKLVRKGILKGTNKNSFDLCYLLNRVLVMLDRAEVFELKDRIDEIAERLTKIEK